MGIVRPNQKEKDKQMTLGETLTLDMSATSRHIRACTMCKNDETIKRKVMEIAMFIMDGDIPSSLINQTGLQVNELITVNHPIINEEGHIRYYIHVTKIPS
jgi:hypothetical protein